MKRILLLIAAVALGAATSPAADQSVLTGDSQLLWPGGHPVPWTRGRGMSRL